MKQFTSLSAVAAPLDLAHVDTDKLMPARFLLKPRSSTMGYGSYLFHNIRFNTDGSERPDFVLNRKPYRNAGILVADENFGCGSSREGAVYALMDYGFRAVIAPSFGDIHYVNEIQNGMLPVILPDDVCKLLRRRLQDKPGEQLSIDLAAQTVATEDGRTWAFLIDAIYKDRLLKGTDEVSLVLEFESQIADFENRRHGTHPWLA